MNDTIVSNWLETVLPKSAKPGFEYQFPAPAGATWEQFVFEFYDGKIIANIFPQFQPED